MSMEEEMNWLSEEIESIDDYADQIRPRLGSGRCTADHENALKILAKRKEMYENILSYITEKELTDVSKAIL